MKYMENDIFKEEIVSFNKNQENTKIEILSVWKRSRAENLWK